MEMRAITGAKRGTGHDRLYFNTGLEQLRERGKRQKLTPIFQNEQTKSTKNTM